MPHPFIRLSMGLLIVALGACSPEDPDGYTGYLYFAQGNYLTRFSLRDGNLSVAANSGDLAIREISRFGESRLFLTGTAAIGDRTVPRISWIDLKTGEIVSLYSGILARYMADAEVVVYDDGIKLYALQQGTGGGPDEIIHSHGLNRLTTVLEVADSVLLFEAGEPGRRVIRSWNAVTGRRELREDLTAACELVGAVWVGMLQKLACRERGSDADANRYALVSLDGEISGRLTLPEGGRFTALTYLPGQDALVFRESWRSPVSRHEKSAVWIHDLRSGGNSRLSRHVNLGQSVVFTEL